jgi:hypothetical protein
MISRDWERVTGRYGGRREPISSPHEDLLLRKLVAETPNITLVEIGDAQRPQLGLSVRLATLHLRLYRLGLFSR